jgi:hypothetical protein
VLLPESLSFALMSSGERSKFYTPEIAIGREWQIGSRYYQAYRVIVAAFLVDYPSRDALPIYAMGCRRGGTEELAQAGLARSERRARSAWLEAV